MTQVIVIGRLGELVKKICELEFQLETEHDEVFALELAGYHSVLDSWPVEDKPRTDLLVSMLRISVRHYIECENALRLSLDGDSASILALSAVQYLQQKDEIRNFMRELNALGRFVGNIPTLQIEDKNRWRS